MAKRRQSDVQETLFTGRNHQQTTRSGSLVEPGLDRRPGCEETWGQRTDLYRWKKEYGGLDKTQARKLKELGKQNLQLKKLVADLSLDNAILKEILSKK